MILRSILSVALLSVVACSSEPKVVVPTDAGGVDARVVDASDGATLPFPLNQTCQAVTLPDGTEDKACAECSQSKCCDSLKAVTAFADAATLAKCIHDATTDDEEAACFTKYPAPTQALLDHGACKSYRCTGICTDPPTACAACTNEKCLVESLACDRSKDCYLFSSCSGACKNQACIDACGTKYPAGRDIATPFTTCSLTRCASECK
ncbi:MAG: hypothetical protein HOO96_03035 [Polyangiaceae bacterium]|nr:hypothetical protein [Polyangiaceae bacterium]